MATPETPTSPSAQRKALDAADEVVLEYVAFRGFNEVFRALNAARADDATRRGAYDATFATDALLKPIQTLDHAALLDAWDFLSQRLCGKPNFTRNYAQDSLTHCFISTQVNASSGAWTRR